MGNILEALNGALKTVLYSGFFNTQAKILMLGLDAAGKTTVLYKLKVNEVVSTIPTLGFNVETVKHGNNVSFTVWDIGGQKVIRKLWKHYFVGTGGLVFVVDSVDKSRFGEAKEELEWILDSDEMAGVPVVIMANKQDMPNACSTSDVAEKLGLNQVRDRKWYVHGTSALSGEGVLESVTELSKLVKEFQRTVM
ncbi:ADP-ribosylation factor 1-like [Halichondria panicea]|uniref:ADP-ribosylation factor 1-like n=1 Tax=Halichondria panicea TaxID=6063 RepID=UPI00312B84AE